MSFCWTPSYLFNRVLKGGGVQGEGNPEDSGRENWGFLQNIRERVGCPFQQFSP